jgi:MFS family permease
VLEIAASGQLALFCVGRLVAGLGVGFISAVIILYISEIAPKKVRGALVSGYQFCITIGILLANCVVYATQDRLDTGSYRIPVGVQFLWSVVLGVGLLFLPESPRYFVRKGELEKAVAALASVRSQPIESEYVQDELAEIVANHEFEMSLQGRTSYVGSWVACFKGGFTDGSSNLRRSILGIGKSLTYSLPTTTVADISHQVFKQCNNSPASTSSFTSEPPSSKPLARSPTPS